MIDDFNNDFSGVPVAWILLGLCVMAQLGSWETGGDLDRVCALTAEHEIAQAAPELAKLELDHICLNHRAEL